MTMGVKKSRVEDESVNYNTAYERYGSLNNRVHECGHALISLLTPNYPTVDKITCLLYTSDPALTRAGRFDLEVKSSIDEEK